MSEEKYIKALIFVCPNCGFEELDSLEELRKQYGFDGKNFDVLPQFECHGCHEYYVEPKRIEEIPASWAEPF